MSFRNLPSKLLYDYVRPYMFCGLPLLKHSAKSRTISVRYKSNSNKQITELFPHYDEYKRAPLHPSKYSSTDGLVSEKSLPARREQFALAVNEFKKREKYRKGHVEFVKLAVQRMEEYQLQKDINVYNQIISIFPVGRFAPRRMLDSIWPRSLPQLELSLDILTKMEENGIRPNQETYNLLNEIFGKMSLPIQKCIRIAHLFDKYEYADPYKIYGEIPTDPVELSKLILYRMTGGHGSIKVHKESTGKQNAYILSACTKAQVCLLQSDVRDSLLHIEGPHRLWQHSLEQFYYTLRLIGGHSAISEDQPESTKEGAVLSVCMCHPGTQQTLQEWMEILQEDYPNLTDARVVYDIKEIDIGDSDEVMQISSKEGARTEVDLLSDRTKELHGQS